MDDASQTTINAPHMPGADGKLFDVLLDAGDVLFQPVEPVPPSGITVHSHPDGPGVPMEETQEHDAIASGGRAKMDSALAEGRTMRMRYDEARQVFTAENVL